MKTKAFFWCINYERANLSSLGEYLMRSNKYSFTNTSLHSHNPEWIRSKMWNASPFSLLLIHYYIVTSNKGILFHFCYQIERGTLQSVHAIIDIKIAGNPFSVLITLNVMFIFHEIWLTGGNTTFGNVKTNVYIQMYQKTSTV